MTRHRLRAVLLLFLLLNLTACVTWQDIATPSQAQFIEIEQPDRVRVTMQDRTQMELERPVVDGDELVAAGGSVSLADVRLLEIGKISLVRSGLAGFGIFVGGIILIQFVECGVGGTWAC
ncbi:uncharacterized protein METZ01_LOCUS500379 [marine metagenome]|uniref:Uncharacterized protein n=1 Tax=marine metagenome TaxID=408172 RepID=A0A383DTG9_9ZZZZ